MRWTLPTSILLALLLAQGCKPEPPELKPTPTAEPVHETEADERSSLADPPSTGGMQGLPAGHPPIGGADRAPAHQPTPEGGEISGTVTEITPAGKYVYLKLKSAKGEIQAAILKAPVEVGQAVRISNANLIRDFESPTLGRTIDAIWFGVLADRDDTAPAPAAPAPAPVEVAAAEGDGARTIGEVYAQKDSLVGQTVTVRGKVVKYNAGILDRNWLHLQDGTGDAAAGTHDLTVTTDAAAAVGDLVTIKGTVARDKDFGAGYRYPVLIEDATVTSD